MAKDKGEWKVRAIWVQFIDGKRVERPMEDFSKEELREIGRRMNEKALRAAGYIPVREEEGREHGRKQDGEAHNDLPQCKAV